jgi:hypothetical protein
VAHKPVSAAKAGRREGGTRPGSPSRAPRLSCWQPIAIATLGPMRAGRGRGARVGCSAEAAQGVPRQGVETVLPFCASCATADGWHAWHSRLPSVGVAEGFPYAAASVDRGRPRRRSARFEDKLDAVAIRANPERI